MRKKRDRKKEIVTGEPNVWSVEERTNERATTRKAQDFTAHALSS
jgi:hypothetical protein